MTNQWTEDHSRHFIDLGRIYTPDRDEIAAAIVALLPVAEHEPFLAVELGIGAGWLSEAILTRYPVGRILGLDASPLMLRASADRLQRFAGRFELRPFRLEDHTWLDDIMEPVRCFVSSLVIHHLDAAGKQALYPDLYQHLDEPGAVLIADLIAPRGERERLYLAQAWDEAVRRQSLTFTGSDAAYQQFMADHWNWYAYPDPMDVPSAIPDHLAWLTAAGFKEVNVFWERAGHAVYGGYKAVTS